ncbi:MAG: undecaprenyl/decaprenyl-phosphate alpha-N-acetylglucosaminyl 1-phosphate transferase [Elusimicrobia bacterium]|nr:undecaprenyl/decaprenyl-phosphate alpha-N-acetylglucosaminyl 1-phosphate transferase [Elusimicrobiota bacterium]
MWKQPLILYTVLFTWSVVVAALLTPICRWWAIRWKILDHPRTSIKTHETPTPYLGGVAILGAFTTALLLARFLTNFPTGTLHALRGILFGGTLIFLLGLVDDLAPSGLGFKQKFIVQIIAALCLIAFDIRIKFIHPTWFAVLVSMVWIVGVTNAFNIIDIMDGLCGGVSAIASLTFLLIALPREELYVDVAAAALAGACLGFLPFNLSAKRKIFMGDTGSLFLGFVLAALSMGTTYTSINNIGLFAPLLILGLPLYDTVLVTFARLRQGRSPFLGSKDHFALRLEAAGFFRQEILVIAYAVSLGLSLGAFIVTRVSFAMALFTYAVIAIASWLIGRWLSRIPSE